MNRSNAWSPVALLILAGLAVGGCASPEEEDVGEESGGAALTSAGRVFDNILTGATLRIGPVSGSEMTVVIGGDQGGRPAQLAITKTTGTLASGSFGPAECSLKVEFEENFVKVQPTGKCQDFGGSKRIEGMYVIRAANAYAGSYAGPEGSTFTVKSSDDNEVIVTSSAAKGGKEHSFRLDQAGVTGGATEYQTVSPFRITDCKLLLDVQGTAIILPADCPFLGPKGFYARSQPVKAY